MEINVIKVTNKKLLKAFIDLEWTIYKGNKYWVPPLKMERKKILSVKTFPFFEDGEMELFIAERNNKFVGRIAAIQNRAYNKSQNENAGFFGFFESIDDQSVANVLFDTAINWVKNKNCDKILGPTNPSSTYGFGVLIEGFDKAQSFQIVYNLPYYQTLIENYGLKKAKDLYVYRLNYKDALEIKQLERVANLVRENSGIIVRSVDFKKNYKHDAETMREILNKAWHNNWGNTPINKAEMDQFAKDLKPMLDEDGILFAEIDQKVVGFFLAILDYNEIIKTFNGKLFPFNIIKLFTKRKTIKTGLIYLFGILPEYRMTGIDALLFWELMNNSYKHGLLTGEAGWILEDNIMMNRAIQKFGGKVAKTYRVYGLDLKP